jgi:hypothetical protein
MKEKYRADMKKELKKLQRLRDFFRQNVNNPTTVEYHVKLGEARRRIEAVSTLLIVSGSYWPISLLGNGEVPREREGVQAEEAVQDGDAE